jgi:serine/threonine protein kinase
MILEEVDQYLYQHLNILNIFGCLGDGAFAEVYCIRHIHSNQCVAIKVADGTNEQARQ